MKKLLVTLFLVLAPALTFAEGMECGSLPECEVAPVNLQDKASLQHGAQVFISYCAGCHSAKYMRYERISQDLNIDPTLMKKYLMFTSDKIGDPINANVNPKEQAKWFGNAPPDLSLEARLRSPDWIYSYLLNFYPDDKRPWGVNNRVFKDVAMPNVLDPLEQELGPDDFKVAVGDLVNYMTYMSEPSRATRESMGGWVLLFLLILFVPVYLLNKEFWKDVK